MDLHSTFKGIKDALDDVQASLVLLNTLSGRVQVLETLLAGVERTVAPDGTQGIYFPTRVGVLTKWFLMLPTNDPTGSAGFSVATGVDKYCAIIQHDGEEGSDGLGKGAVVERVALKVVNTEPNPAGINIGIEVIATNAPHGSIGVQALAQYSPLRASPVATPLVGEEWLNPST